MYVGLMLGHCLRRWPSIKSLLLLGLLSCDTHQLPHVCWPLMHPHHMSPLLFSHNDFFQVINYQPRKNYPTFHCLLILRPKAINGRRRPNVILMFAGAADRGPALMQHWVNRSCFMAWRFQGFEHLHSKHETLTQCWYNVPAFDQCPMFAGPTLNLVRNDRLCVRYRVCNHCLS